MCLVAFSKKDHYSALRKVTVQTGNPTWAYIVICDDCSHKCSWCYGGFNKPQFNQMSPNDFRMVIYKCKDMGVVQITIAGGEPTEHPNFLEFVNMASSLGFIVHIASHGEHIDEKLAEQLSMCDVKQVQFNFQGQRYHDKIHGVTGSYTKQIKAIKELNLVGIETTTTVTVGHYNIKHIKEIFSEAANLGVSRLRVWEATGLGNGFRKSLEAKEIFKECQTVAHELGYIHTLSYDPDFIEGIAVPCLQLSNLFLYIDSNSKLKFCGAVKDSPNLADFINDAPNEIIRKYKEYNQRVLQSKGVFCAAREGL